MRCGHPREVAGSSGQLWADVVGHVRATAGSCGKVREAAGNCGKLRADAGRRGKVREAAGRCGKVREGAGRCGKVREAAGRCGKVRAHKFEKCGYLTNDFFRDHKMLKNNQKSGFFRPKPYISK